MKFIILVLIITNCFSYEFIISYRAIVKNHSLIGEEFFVSRPVKNTKQYEVIGICNLDLSSTDLDSNLPSKIQKILKQNKDFLLDCISKATHISIRDDLKFINNAIFSKTTFKLPPQRILVDSNSNEIKIIREK